MFDWFRTVLMIFYSPARGLREMRDRGALGQAAFIALLSQVAYLLVTQWLSGEKHLVFGGPRAAAGLLFQSAISLLLIAGVLTPLIAFVGNLFERRGSFGLLLQQEYASLGSTVLYALAIANLWTVPIAIIFNISGMQAAYIASSLESAAQVRTWLRLSPEMETQLQAMLSDPRMVAASLFRTIKLSFFLVTTVLAVRTVLRASAIRAIVITVISLALALLIAPIWTLLFTPLLASPFLLLMLFFLLRGYIGGIMQTQRARESFKQNMEAATLNPADSSAHYNLGLIHQVAVNLMPRANASNARSKLTTKRLMPTTSSDALRVNRNDWAMQWPTLNRWLHAIALTLNMRSGARLEPLILKRASSQTRATRSNSFSTVVHRIRKRFI